MIDFIKAELARAEAELHKAAQQAEMGRQAIANHQRWQVIVSHLQFRHAEEQAAPAPTPEPEPAPAETPTA